MEARTLPCGGSRVGRNGSLQTVQEGNERANLGVCPPLSTKHRMRGHTCYTHSFFQLNLPALEHGAGSQSGGGGGGGAGGTATSQRNIDLDVSEKITRRFWCGCLTLS